GDQRRGAAKKLLGAGLCSAAPSRTTGRQSPVLRLPQQRMQDPGIFRVQLRWQIVAGAEAAMERTRRRGAVVQRIAERSQRLPRIEPFRRQAIALARPYAETRFGQLLPREEAAGILLARRCKV